MAFPTNPTIGDVYTAGSKTYRWDGNVWARATDGVLTTAFVTQSGSNLFYSNDLVKQYLSNLDGPIVPSLNETYSLGSENKKWANLFLSGNTIVLGNTKIQSSEDGSISIRSTNSQVTSALSFASNGYIAAPSGPISTSSGLTIAAPRISNVQVTDSSYNVLDDTSANSGGYVTINGAYFSNGSTVLIGTTVANSVTFVSSSKLNVALPILSSGTYPVYVVSSDGATAQKINGLSISGTPIFYTAAGNVGINYEGTPLNIAVNAFSDTTITYTLASGTLPSGLTLDANTGIISGNLASVGANTTYNFTINATDLELQNTTRSYSFSTLDDRLTWFSPSNSNTLVMCTGTVISCYIQANTLSGLPVCYTANSLLTGLCLCSNGYYFGTTSIGSPGLRTSLITANTGATSNTISLNYNTFGAPMFIEMLVVAGGGGGGGGYSSYYNLYYGGGGGGGGVIQGNVAYCALMHMVTIGAGGGGGTSSLNASPGSPTCACSTYYNIRSCAGGRGGKGLSNVNSGDQFGGDGGSGGGGGTGAGTPIPRGGYGTPGQGNRGEDGRWGAPGTAGGRGGGKGASGVYGGVGASYSYTTGFSGPSVYYSSGGTYNSGAGPSNTGIGGGMGAVNSTPASSGASGVVIMTYPEAAPEATVFVGGSCSTQNLRRIYCFTSSGCICLA
jgi:hypothetical protein